MRTKGDGVKKERIRLQGLGRECRDKMSHPTIQSMLTGQLEIDAADLEMQSKSDGLEKERMRLQGLGERPQERILGTEFRSRATRKHRDQNSDRGNEF